MDFIAKIRAAIKAKGANAWTDDELEAFFAEDGELMTDVSTFMSANIQDETTGLVAKNKQLLGEKKKLQDQIKNGGDTTAAGLQEELDKLTADLDEARGTLGVRSKEYEKLKNTYDKEKKTLLDAYSAEKVGYNKLLIDNEIASGFGGVSINPVQLGVIKKAIRDRLIVVDDAGERKAVVRFIDTDGKEAQLPCKDYVEKVWAPSEEGKAFIISKGNGGSVPIPKGAGGSDPAGKGTAPVNPFADLGFADGSKVK